jgi:quercetin dioxygenase-like cupin family protein
VPVFDNATASAIRLTLAPGAREQPHTHPSPMLVVFLTAAAVEMRNGAAHKKGARKIGEIEFIKPATEHFAANVGSMPLEALVISLKAGRAHGGPAFTGQATPGVTRTPLLDNADVTVTKLEFEADVREPVHTHAHDLVVIPITAARLDVQVGDKKNVRGYGVGEAIWIPRLTPHAVANVGTASMRLLGVVVK